LPFDRAVFDRYFDAWQRHDEALLREIFHDDATYYIRDKRTLTGIEEIVAYWTRNRTRQQGLRVLPYVDCGELAPEGSCVFAAAFTDAEVGVPQLVYGILRLIMDGDKIIRLEEAYHRNDNLRVS
jgi:hypothetical protein